MFKCKDPEMTLYRGELYDNIYVHIANRMKYATNVTRDDQNRSIKKRN